jgi:hypothetical protein
VGRQDGRLSRGTVQIRVSTYVHETVRDLSASQTLQGSLSHPTIAQVVDEIFEIALRCIETHDTDFCAPARHPEALTRFGPRAKRRRKAK